LEEEKPQKSDEKGQSRKRRLREVDNPTKWIRDEFNPNREKIHDTPERHLKKELRFPIKREKIIDNAEQKNENAAGEKSPERPRQYQMRIHSNYRKKCNHHGDPTQTRKHPASSMPGAGASLTETEEGKRKHKRQENRHRKRKEKREKKQCHRTNNL
jgi:hypothetical protein